MADIIKLANDILKKSKESKPLTKEDVKNIVSEINIPAPIVTVNVPEQKEREIIVRPEVNVPQQEAPTVNVPAPIVKVTVPPIKIPDMKWPEDDMPIRGWVQLMGVSMENPLPVQIRDAKGNPLNLFENITQILGGGGGKHDYFTIKGFNQSAYADLTNADGRLRVSVETGGSAITDAELRASAVPVSQVSGSIWSTNAAQSGSWTVAVSSVSGTTSAAYTRQTNPTAIASDYVPLAADDLGRQLIRPVQVRDLMATAYVQLTNGTETTLLAASAGVYHDLIYVMGANNSDVAVSVDIRAVTGGNTVMTIQIPASGTAGVATPVPYPQQETGNNWTADMGDITGTTVSLTALFSKEV